MIRLVLALVLSGVLLVALLAAALAEDSQAIRTMTGPGLSAEWCAGWNAAVTSMMRNRDHNRRMTAALPFADETHRQTLERLASDSHTWDKLDAPIGIAVVMLDSIDLYVVVNTRCEATP